MKSTIYFYFLAFALVIFGCAKEKSFEQSNIASRGSLQADGLGECLPKTVNGAYVVGIPLVADSNTISVTVNVATTGNYVITTDTVNGFYFKGTGLFTSVGANTIKLKGNGTPFAAGTNNFLVKYDSSECDLQVIVLPAGSGGPAVFTWQGAPDTCGVITANGLYWHNAPLNTTNTLTFNVNVTKIGTYSITTSFQGMSFANAGTFGSLGVQQVTLNGSGSPTIEGTNVVPITIGGTICSVQIVVESIAIGTLGGSPGTCTSSVVAGTYTENIGLTNTNTVQIQINVTTAGPYYIATDTVGGFSFSASGTATVGTQAVTLNGSGTPTSSGSKLFTVRFGTSACTFNVTVLAGTPLSSDYFPRTAGSNWSYEFNNTESDSVLVFAISPTKTVGTNIFNIFMQNDGTSLDSSGYYRKAGGDYFIWQDIGTALGTGSPNWAELIFLKDNVPLNTNWKSQAFTTTVSGTSFILRLSLTIKQKDVAMSIITSTGTVNYQNVITVEEKVDIQTAPNVWVDGTSIFDFYTKSSYARGIGQVQFQVLNSNNVETDVQKLRRRLVL